MAILSNTTVSGNLRSNGLITTDSLTINGKDVTILDPTANIIDDMSDPGFNAGSNSLVSSKQVVDYIKSKRVNASGNGPTTSWPTGWITAGQRTVPYSSVQSDQVLDAGESVTLSSGWLSRDVTVSVSDLLSQTDGTATADDILEGETAWVYGEQITGTIPTMSISDIEGSAQADYDVETIANADAVPAGGYLNIPAGYYADGISIALGTIIKDIEDDAAATNILSGKKVYDEAGNVITGSMPNRGQVTQTINTQNGTYTIQEGYHDGTGVITATLPNGTTTPNTTLPSGSTAESSETLAGKYVKVGAGYYASDKYYKAKSLADQTGVDSGKTAAGAPQILTGYQAWVNGNKVSGTMADNSSATNRTISMVVNNGNYEGSWTVPQGYHAGSQVISASVPVTGIDLSASVPTITVGSVEENPTITMASGSESNMSTGAAYLNAKDTANYPYYFKINAETAGISTTASITTNAITYTNNAGYLPEHSTATTLIGAGSGSASVTIGAASQSGYIGVRRSSITFNGGGISAGSGEVGVDSSSSGVSLGSTNNGLSVRGRGSASVSAATYSASIGFTTAVSDTAFSADSATSSWDTKYISKLTIAGGNSLGTWQSTTSNVSSSNAGVYLNGSSGSTSTLTTYLNGYGRLGVYNKGYVQIYNNSTSTSNTLTNASGKKFSITNNGGEITYSDSNSSSTLSVATSGTTTFDGADGSTLNINGADNVYYGSYEITENSSGYLVFTYVTSAS